MKNEKPIIMGAESILAILNLKPDTWPPEPIDPSKSWKWQARRLVTAPCYKDKKSGKLLYQDKYGERRPMEEVCPYPPGTVLWVRETWAHAFADTTVCGSTYTLQDRYVYKADNPDLIAKWRPPIHMPREAARLFLEVKNVRAERLQDITEEDAQAEGFINDVEWEEETIEEGAFPDYHGLFAWERFSDYWDHIYAKRYYPCESNPWVWVYEFGRIDNYGKN